MKKPEPNTEKPTTLVSNFVQFVIKKCKTDKGFAANLKRADNPDTEYQSWETLARFQVNLEKPWERLPFAVVAAGIAKTKPDQNGTSDLGEALAGAYEAGSDQGAAKLRRLLACQSVEELCRVLRPLLSLIESKSKKQLDFVKLLKQLKLFYGSPERVKAQWAQNYYHKPANPNPGEPS